MTSHNPKHVVNFKYRITGMLLDIIKAEAALSSDEIPETLQMPLLIHILPKPLIIEISFPFPCVSKGLTREKLASLI